jgi:hypothetical protein
LPVTEFGAATLLGMTNLVVLSTLLVTLLVPSCASDEPPPTTKVYDFAGMRLADAPRVTQAGPATEKRRIRDAFEAQRPRLLACAAADPAAGTLGVVVQFSSGAVDSLRFDAELADHETLTACFRDVLAGMAPVMPEDEVWQVHYPILIGR